jgi:hypothetical protein
LSLHIGLDFNIFSSQRQLYFVRDTATSYLHRALFRRPMIGSAHAIYTAVRVD